MAVPSSLPGLQKTFYIGGTLVLVVVCLSQAQQVLVLLALAVLVTLVLMPVVAAVERRGMKRVLAVLLSVLLAFSVLGGVGWAITLQFGKVFRRIPDYTGKITDKMDTLRAAGPGGLSKLQDSWKAISKEIDELTEKAAGDEDKNALPVRLVAPNFAWFPKVLGPTLEILASALVILILVIFMLIKREDLRNRLIQLIGRGHLTATTHAIDEAVDRISRYLLMQFTINLFFGAVLGFGLFLIGLVFNQPEEPSYALLWGCLAAGLRFIPYVGTWVAAMLPLIYNVAIADSWVQPVAVLALFAALELFTFNVMEPLLFSHSTGVSPVALLVAVIFWAWLWGPIGVLLSTPLTTCLVVLGRYVPQLEFLNVILGSEPVLETEVSYYQRLLARDQDEAADLVEDYVRNHPLEGVYDHLLLPALVMAKRDRERDELTAEDEQFILKVTRDILEDLLPQQQFNLIASRAVSVTEPAEPSRPKVLVFGLPAQDESDELALEMLRQLLEPSGAVMEVGSARMLASEVRSWVKEKQPALVCIGALPPGGVAQARYLCKRLRSQFPDLKIAVGYWGQKDNVEKIRERLRSAGADFVATSLLDSRSQVVPLIRVAAVPQASKEAEVQTAGRH